MKIRLYLLVSCVLLVLSVKAQDSIAIFKRANSFLLGLSPAVRSAYVDSSYGSVPQFGGSVRFGYFPVSKLAIMGEFGKYASTDKAVAKHGLFTASLSGRYYWNGNRSGIYTNLGYTLSDAQISRATNNQTNLFPSHYATLGGGLSLKVAQNFFLDLSLNGLISLNGKDTRSYVSNSIGVDYIFNTKYDDRPKLKRVKVIDTTDFGKKGKFQLATGFFHFPFPTEDFGEKYNESLWTSKFGYYIHKNFTIGLMAGLTYSRPEIQPNRVFYSVGPYVNYKFVGKQWLLPYLETGYNYSNYSLSEVGLPRKSATHYVNLGGGFNIRIKKDLYIDAGIVLQESVGAAKESGGSSSIFRVGVEYTVR